MRRSLLLIPLLLVFCFSINSAAIAQEPFCEPIDDFQNSANPVTVLSLENPGPVNFVEEDAGIVGNFRNVTFGPLITSGVPNSVLVIEAGLISASNAPGALANLQLVYDANGTGLNLDLSTRDFLTFVLQSNDLVGTSFNIVLRDSDGNENNFLIPNLPNTIEGDTLPTDIDIPLTSFQNVDLSDIQVIEIFLNPTPEGSADTTFNSIEICGPPPPANVPTLSEWGMIAMAGVLGLVGFMVARRRKVTA